MTPGGQVPLNHKNYINYITYRHTSAYAYAYAYSTSQSQSQMGRGLLIQSVAVYVAGIGIKKYSRQGIEGQSQSAMFGNSLVRNNIPSCFLYCSTGYQDTRILLRNKKQGQGVTGQGGSPFSVFPLS